MSTNKIIYPCSKKILHKRCKDMLLSRCFFPSSECDRTKYERTLYVQFDVTMVANILNIVMQQQCHIMIKHWVVNVGELPNMVWPLPREYNRMGPGSPILWAFVCVLCYCNVPYIYINPLKRGKMLLKEQMLS